MPSISKQLGPKSPFLTYFTLLSNEDRNRLTNRTNLNWFNFGVLRLWYGGKSLYDWIKKTSPATFVVSPHRPSLSSPEPSPRSKTPECFRPRSPLLPSSPWVRSEDPDKVIDRRYYIQSLMIWRSNKQEAGKLHWHSDLLRTTIIWDRNDKRSPDRSWCVILGQGHGRIWTAGCSCAREICTPESRAPWRAWGCCWRQHS